MLNPDGTLQTSCFHFPTPLHIFLYVSGLYRSIPAIPGLKGRTLQKMTSEAARPVPWILGAALAFRRETVDGLGGFDENFFMYFEEVDLCYRLFSQRRQVHFVPAAEIVHVGGGSTTQKKAWSSIQFFASLAQFYRKHYSKLMLTEMVLSVKAVALLKMARDFVLLQTTRDPMYRSALEVNLEIHTELFFGGWHRHPQAEMVVHA
jgi:GT2 family glycosyltransferase